MGTPLTPAALAAQCKEETIPVSLRMKERTNLYFNYIAQKYNTNTSSLINGLLDHYVEENSDADFETFIKIFAPLERLKRQFITMTDEELFDHSGSADFIDDFRDNKLTPATWLAGLAKGSDINHDGLVLSSFGKNASIAFLPDVVEKCEIFAYDHEAADKGTSSEINDRIDNTCPDAEFLIEVPFKKWLYMAGILAAFEENYQACTGKDLEVEPAALRDLIRAIDSVPPLVVARQPIVFINAIIASLRNML